jgi:hypothetical protein
MLRCRQALLHTIEPSRTRRTSRDASGRSFSSQQFFNHLITDTVQYVLLPDLASSKGAFKGFKGFKSSPPHEILYCTTTARQLSRSQPQRHSMHPSSSFSDFANEQQQIGLRALLRVRTVPVMSTYGGRWSCGDIRKCARKSFRAALLHLLLFRQHLRSTNSGRLISKRNLAPRATGEPKPK